MAYVDTRYRDTKRNFSKWTYAICDKFVFDVLFIEGKLKIDVIHFLDSNEINFIAIPKDF
jgi:hypothetical protein